MECYAYQRRQCQPGGWKDGREGELGVIGTVAPGAGVLDRSMCSALGGGDLSKALSTAYKGAIAKAESEVRWVGGWVGSWMGGWMGGRICLSLHGKNFPIYGELHSYVCIASKWRIRTFSKTALKFDPLVDISQ